MIFMISYVFRAPKFPILVRVPPTLIALKSRQHASRVLVPELFHTDKSCDIIDATGEGFSLLPGLMAISPLTFNKGWTKRELIELYNETAEGSIVPYSLKPLSNKRFDRITREIATLLLSPKAGH